MAIARIALIRMTPLGGRAALRNILVVTLLVGLFIAVAQPSANASDIFENLVFTGTGTCIDPSCTSFGNGPITGNYTLDVTTQTIVGPWSFSTPFGMVSSTLTGASAFVTPNFPPGSTDIAAAFQVLTSSPNFLEFVQFFFPGTNTLEIGDVITSLDPKAISSGACYDESTSTTQQCFPGYVVAGSTTLAPEPSSLLLLGTGLLTLGLLARHRVRVV